MKKRAAAVGLTAFADSSPVASRAISPVTSDAMRVVNFPALPARVVVSRPVADPVLRVCPFCGAEFQDFTRRHNTTYCRASCRVQMSRRKRDTAITALASATGVPVSVVEDLYESRGLREIERLLTLAGWSFVPAAREWVKR